MIVEGVVSVESETIQSATPTAFIKARNIPSRNDPLVNAFKFFVSELNKLEDDVLIRLRDTTVNAQYVNISSSTEEDLYTIFEILNARGLNLNDSDLLKNYIMRYIEPKTKRDDARIVWAEIEQTVGDFMNHFLRHYAIQCCRFSSGDKDGVYRKIRDYTDPRMTQELLDDLRCKADYYARIVNPVIGTVEGDRLAFLRAHRVQVFRPLIMSLMHRLDLEDITQRDYESSLDFIYKFYICYKTIGGLESNHLTDSITKYSFAIEKLFKRNKTLEEWRRSFVEKLPSIDSFTKRFVALGWSHTFQSYAGPRNKDQCKVILKLIESQGSKGRPIGDYTVEHALPDSADETHAAIGNLLLLEHDLNERCRDLPLADKLPIYRESAFVTTRGFAERYVGKSFIVESRTNYLAKYVYGLISK